MSLGNKLITLSARVANQQLGVLIDCGSQGNWINADVVERLGLKVVPAEVNTCVLLADGSRHESFLVVPNVRIKIGNLCMKFPLHVLPIQHDIILGKPWLSAYNPNIDWRFNTVEILHQGRTYVLRPRDSEPFDPTTTMISAAGFRRAIKKGAQAYLALITPENEVLAAPLENDQEKGLLMSLKEYGLEGYKDLFVEDLPHGLPPSRPGHDHKIDVVPGSDPPYQRPRRCSPKELDEMKRQLANLKALGHIQDSDSNYSSNALFVSKKDGSIRMCIDYRALNKITVPNRYPLPRIDELMDRLQGAKVFSKIDLKSGFHQIRVAPEDVPKTAFSTRYGQFEFLVMPFGLTNAPATFQHLMNAIFADYVDEFVVVYMDDILIYSPDKESHKKHLRKVLEVLKKHKLFAAPNKSVLGKSQIEFVGFVVSDQGLSMDPKKLDSIVHWPAPTNVVQVQSFLGLANFYRRFVKGYATIANPLHALTRKDHQFHWGETEQKAFDTLKQALTSAPLLILPDPKLHYAIHTDASDFALGAVLSQDQGQGFQPIEYMSATLSSAERNYPTHEKEMLAIIMALRHWRHYVEGAPTVVYADNHSLQYFQRQPTLSRRQARWLETLAIFGSDLTIQYIPGKDNVVADALSRRAGLEFNMVCKSNSSTHLVDTYHSRLVSAYNADSLATRLLKGEGSSTLKYEVSDGLIYYVEGSKRCLYVPEDSDLRNMIMRENHDIPISGHLGRDKTLANVKRYFYWVGMNDDVARYVSECPTCQVTKGSNKKTPGLLQPLPIPQRRWEQIHMDLIGPLPQTAAGHTAILTVVDRLTKMGHFIPTVMTVNAVKMADLFVENVFRLHGMPSVIISDRDPRFTSNFWQSFMDTLGTTLKLSTAYHPQTDGQAERHNRTIEDMLRAFVDQNKQDNWDKLLAPLEFAYNNSVNVSTQYTPFYMVYGEHPLTPVALLNPTESSVPKVEELVAKVRETIVQAKRNLAVAQQRQQQSANRSRRHEEFHVGDEVLLSTSNIGHMPSSMKLTTKFIGPFPIIEKVGDLAYKLALPAEYRMHDTVNVTSLKKYIPPSQKRDEPHQPPPVFFEKGKPLWNVEAIVGKRGEGPSLRYQVKWAGYAEEHNTWEPVSNLKKKLVWKMVQAFEKKLNSKKRRRE